MFDNPTLFAIVINEKLYIYTYHSLQKHYSHWKIKLANLLSMVCEIEKIKIKI